MNYKLKEHHYKMCAPEDTIDNLKRKLSDIGIIVEEKMSLESSIDTNSLRLVLSGTDIGTNGKGISKEYAMASAYAEFFERLENQHLNSFVQLSDENTYGFYLFSDEKIIHYEELMQQKDAFIKFYLDTTKISKDDFLKLHVYDSCKTGVENSYISVPFFDYKENRVVYLPYSIYRPWYGSNGMCAGNSPAEALVQGMAEIFERIVMKEIIENKLSLPDIPEDYIKQYPYVYERFLKLRENNNYYVRMIDCSLEGEFPVAGLLLVEKNTGNYGLKLGCHPDYGIAMERTMTEASQGQDIFDFTNSSFLDFANENVFSEMNLAHCYMTGEGQYPYQLFSHIPKYDFVTPKNVDNKSNEELLEQMINKIQKRGFNVLIRDVSYLGFPAFHIIIPGLSEMGIATSEDYEMIRSLNYHIKYFRNPYLVNDKIAVELMKILQHFSYRNYFSFFMHTENVELIPWENIGESVHYYQAALAIAQGEYTEAIYYLTMISQKLAMFEYVDDEAKWLLSLIYYLSARQEIDDHKEIMRCMYMFFDNIYCERINDLFDGEAVDNFNNSLFCKLVGQYKDNEKDNFVKEMMDNNCKAMVGHMPLQKRII